MRDPGLIVVDGGWRDERVSETGLRLTGAVGLRAGGRRAVLVRDVTAETTLLSAGSIDGLVVLTSVARRSRRGPARADGRWRAQVVAPAGRAQSGLGHPFVAPPPVDDDEPRVAHRAHGSGR